LPGCILPDQLRVSPLILFPPLPILALQ